MLENGRYPCQARTPLVQDRYETRTRQVIARYKPRAGFGCQYQPALLILAGVWRVGESRESGMSPDTLKGDTKHRKVGKMRKRGSAGGRTPPKTGRTPKKALLPPVRT